MSISQNCLPRFHIYATAAINYKGYEGIFFGKKAGGYCVVYVIKDNKRKLGLRYCFSFVFSYIMLFLVGTTVN